MPEARRLFSADSHCVITSERVVTNLWANGARMRMYGIGQ